VRLNQVKLSGFKSFVDPTVFQLPGQLVGVVGPNGCGKSNIIDAVRWVLGESKASELRGESMQDVIFNGSIHRKPSSRASVELVFSNELGRAGGQWSQFVDIAVKRVLTRDGASNYYINNQVVRRRDVQDIFMGTGLGPRAYAIIGQGMISRIIEAKPDELRVFLEEAAGVTKYKERRRETENRLSDTRDNLLRVDDILRELNGQITKLGAQAEVATRYQGLKTGLQDDQCLLAFLRQSDAAAERERLSQHTEAAQTRVEQAIAKLRSQEAALEQARSAQYGATDALQTAQAAVFEASSAVAQLEADIRLHDERRSRLQGDIARQTAEQVQWAARSVDAQQAQGTHAARLDELAATLEQQHAQMEEFEVHSEDCLIAKDEAQARLDTARIDVSEVDKKLRALSAERGVLAQNQRTAQAALERAQQAKAGLVAPDQAKLATAQVAMADAQSQQAALQSQLDAAASAHISANEALGAAQNTHSSHRGEVQRLEARHAALEKLQHDMRAASKIQGWLDKHGLGSQARFWQQCRVDTGWEAAVQAVLRHRAQALQLHSETALAGLGSLANDAPPAPVSFFAPVQPAPAAAPAVASFATGAHLTGLTVSLTAPSLLSRIKLQDPALASVAAAWLGNAYCAESLHTALAQRASLPAGGVWVTAQGHRVDAVSVQLYAPETLEDNALARQQELEHLALQLKAEHLQASQAQATLQRCQSAVQQASSDKDRYAREIQQFIQGAHRRELEVLQLQQAVQQFEARAAQLQGTEAELSTQLSALDERLASIDDNMASADEQLAAEQTRFEDLRTALEAAQTAVNTQRQREQTLKNSLQELQYQQRSAQDRLNEAQRTLSFAADNSARAVTALALATTDLAALGDNAAHSALQAAIATRLSKEQALAAQRTQMDALTTQLRQQDEQRMAIERTVEPLRSAVMELQLKEQAARLAVEQFAEQLKSLGADVLQLAAQQAQGDMPKPATVAARITNTQREIDSLGAVNLAALQELTESQARQTFLSSQELDLKTAMETLEDAIRKIDRETREMLKTTFDQVNHHFGLLFPQLFGGGDAKLVMTGDEILDAGVQVIAQPPGKRNSSIHLLSGGEKALTATALVFAIFQLNPAPFCLLDEVDAPLDDSNTERFAKMVSSMSKHTQFVFISHNKIAMEMAQQLIGVTMQEQGVSRIVAVDMESAVKLMTQAGLGAESAATLPLLEKT
jgi:chromosome segregation protein